MQLHQVRTGQGLGTERVADARDAKSRSGESVRLLHGPGPPKHPEEAHRSSVQPCQLIHLNKYLLKDH